MVAAQSSEGKKETVVFDFDGTLVSKDTGYEFNKWLIQRSVFRVLLILLFSPIIILLIYPDSTRKVGLNIASVIATAFQPKSLFYLRANFVRHYFNKAGAVVFAEGLDELRGHQLIGRSVVILSGCPRWLLSGVAKHIGISGVIIVGSVFKVKNRSLVLVEHCYKENKLKLAADYGLKSSDWVAGYSDSMADLPMLRKCDRKVLVNIASNKLAVFRSRLNGPVSLREWA